MRYQYSPLHGDTHRDVAHWRGAKGGLRELSLPTCTGWLRRQANDACYDFWPDLAIGNQLTTAQTGGPALPAPATFIMQKDADGAWFIDAWQGDRADGARPQAANTTDPQGCDAANVDDSPVSRNTYAGAPIKSTSDSPADSPTPTAQQSPAEHADDQHGPTSFIIELGRSPR